MSPVVRVVFTGSSGSGGGCGCHPVFLIPSPAGKDWDVRYRRGRSTRKWAREGFLPDVSK